MIDTLFFALQIVGVVILIGWAVVHDRLREGMPTRGPLAFKQDDGPVGENIRDRRKSGGSAKRRSRAVLDGERP